MAPGPRAHQNVRQVVRAVVLTMLPRLPVDGERVVVVLRVLLL